tara:strand:+ start:1463 stop:2467 length:1005 start_codon:yes stop_codon:yes gene_type:complete
MPTTQELLNMGGGLLNTAGNYLNTEDAIDSARAAGQQAVAGGNQISADVIAGTEFKPYTVTSNLATSTAGPSGGVTQTLSPDEQRRQDAYLGSAETLFGGVGGDTNAQTQALYDQLRAIQAPAEMRRQQATQEQMFGRGTGGMTSGIYGGSGMQFADAQARQEQQGRDMFMARGMVGDEQDRRLLQAQGLMDAGYNPSNQASDMFSTGYQPASLVSQGAIRGQELSANAKSTALTQMINAEVIAGNLSRKQAQDLLTTVTGSADASGNYTGGLLGGAADWLLGQASNALGGGSSLLDPTQYTYDQQYADVPDYQDVATGIDLTNYNILDDANYS